MAPPRQTIFGTAFPAQDCPQGDLYGDRRHADEVRYRGFFAALVAVGSDVAGEWMRALARRISIDR